MADGHESNDYSLLRDHMLAGLLEAKNDEAGCAAKTKISQEPTEGTSDIKGVLS